MLRFLAPIALPIALLFSFASEPASAHALDNGYSKIAVEGKFVSYELDLPASALLSYDKDGDGELSGEEIASARSDIESYIQSNLFVSLNGAEAIPVFVSLDKQIKNGLPYASSVLRFESPAPVSAVDVRYNLFFDDLDPIHLSFAAVHSAKEDQQFMFSSASRELHYKMDSPPGVWESALQYFRLGVEHILTGYDHLAFLLALIVAAPRISAIAKIVTAFTAAHSLTLFLAATGYISIPSVWIESAIALSIAYVAAENVIRKTESKRWILVFFFGLIHGAGFAGALVETGLPKAHLIPSLLSFNLGVEAGQLAVVLAVLPLLWLIKKRSWHRKFIVASSCAVFLLAAFWLLQRVGIIG